MINTAIMTCTIRHVVGGLFRHLNPDKIVSSDFSSYNICPVCLEQFHFSQALHMVIPSLHEISHLGCKKTTSIIQREDFFGNLLLPSCRELDKKIYTTLATVL